MCLYYDGTWNNFGSLYWNYYSVCLAGETDKHNETSEIQGENKLSLSTGPGFPSKPITDDDGSSPREVEADQPKKRKDCVIQQVQNVRGMKKEKDKDVDDISQSRSKTDETTEKERRSEFLGFFERARNLSWIPTL